MLYKKDQIQCKRTKTRAGMLAQSAASTSKILQHQNAASTVQIRDLAFKQQ
jgi:hypothetical protein